MWMPRSSNPELYDQVLSALAVAGLSAPFVESTGTTTATFALVADGYGWCLCCPAEVADAATTLPLVWLPLSGVELIAETWAVWSADRASPVAAEVLDVLSDIASRRPRVPSVRTSASQKRTSRSWTLPRSCSPILDHARPVHLPARVRACSSAGAARARDVRRRPRRRLRHRRIRFACPSRRPGSRRSTAGRDVDRWRQEFATDSVIRPDPARRVPAAVLRPGVHRSRSSAPRRGPPAIVERWQPDLLVHEIAEFAAPLVAALDGIPYATMGVRTGAPARDRRARRHGDGSPLAGSRPAPSRRAALPFAVPRSVSARPSGAGGGGAPGSHPDPPRTGRVRASDSRMPSVFDDLPSRSTVYVTLGTIFNRDHDTFATVFAAWRTADQRDRYRGSRRRPGESSAPSRKHALCFATSPRPMCWPSATS